MDKQTIIEGLRHCSTNTTCEGCPYEETGSHDCIIRLVRDALELIEGGSQEAGNGDFVSRQYLLAEYDRQHQGPPGGARKIIEEAPAADVISRQDAMEVLDELPPADVVPVRHGTWLPIVSYNNTYKCSECGRLLVDITDGLKMVAKNYPYCHCGARMDGERKE